MPTEDVGEELQEPISKKILGESLADVVDRLTPKPPTVADLDAMDPIERIRAETNRMAPGKIGGEIASRTAKTAAGVLDFMQSPEGIAAAIAEAASGGTATPVIATLLGAQFATQGGKQAAKALDDIRQNGMTPENTEAFGQGLTTALMGAIGPLGAHELESHAAKIRDTALANKDHIQDLVSKSLPKMAESRVHEPADVAFSLESQPVPQSLAPEDVSFEPTSPEAAAPVAQAPETAPAPEVAVAPQPETPVATPETKEAESETPAPNPEPEAPKEEMAPDREAQSLQEESASLKRHPVRGEVTGGAVLPADEFNKALEDGTASATPEQRQDYLNEMRATLEGHLPDDRILRARIDLAQKALDGGDNEAFAAAAEDARRRISSEVQSRFAMANAEAGGFGDEYRAKDQERREAENAAFDAENAKRTDQDERFQQSVKEMAQSKIAEWAEAARDAREAHKGNMEQGRYGQELNALGQDLRDQQFNEARKPGSAGVKEGSPLDGLKELPSQLLEAIDRGKGKLYDKIAQRFEDAVTEEYGDQIREHHARPPEDEGDISFDFSDEETPQLPESKEPGFGERIDQKIEDTREEIRRLTAAHASGQTLGAGLPGDLLQAYIKLGAYHLAKGAVDFKAWSEKMIDDIGEKIRPQLRDIYNRALDRMRAAQDAGQTLDKALSREVTSRYVKNEPFDFKFGKDDKATGSSLRQEFAGLKNSRIVRVAQFADAIRRQIPDKLTREALAWYKDARVRNPSDPAAAIRTALADPQFEPYKAALERALTLNPHQLGILDRVAQYYEEAGRMSRQLGTIGTIRDEYQNRVYAPEQTKDFVKTEMGGGVRPNTSHAKARVFDTMFDAVEGGKKFAITDIADALEIHGREMARVNTSHQLMDVMQSNGIGKWSATKTIPEGWEKVGTLERSVPYVNKDGTAGIANHVFAAPKGIAGALEAIADTRDKFRAIPGVKALQEIQGRVKKADLSFSFFHDFTLAMQAAYQGDFGALTKLPQLTKMLNSPDFREMEIDHARHGGVTAKLEANQDLLFGGSGLIREMVKQSDGTYAEKKSMMDMIDNLPGIKQARAVSDMHSNFLFGKLQRYLKVMDYARQASDWIGKHPDAGPEEIKAAKRAIAAQGNAAFGGLNWEAMGVNKTALSVLRTALLAPDWTISNGVLVRQALKGKDEFGRWSPEGTAARYHYLRATIISTVMLEALNKWRTGHFTDKNPDGHRMEVQLSPGVWVSPFRGGVGDLIKYYSNVVQNGLLKGSAQFSQGKLAPLARTVVGVLSGAEYSGVPISRAKTDLGKDADYASYIARSAGPVPFGVGNLARYAEDRQKTVTGAAGIASGVARYAPASKTAEIKSYLSDTTSKALDNAGIAVGAPKPRLNETPNVSALRKELATKLIDSEVSKETSRPNFDKLSKAEQAKRIHAAITRGHTQEDSFSKRRFPNEKAATDELQRQITLAEQRKARQAIVKPQ